MVKSATSALESSKANPDNPAKTSPRSNIPTIPLNVPSSVGDPHNPSMLLTYSELRKMIFEH